MLDRTAVDSDHIRRSDHERRTIQSVDGKTVAKYFLIWKTALLLVASTSIGPGYDTSTEILFDTANEHFKPSFLGRGLWHLVLRLTRWDAIYFSSSSARGHTNEQDWAFSWSLARLNSFITNIFLLPLSLPLVVKNALTGVLISSFSHFVAVLALYQLTYRIIPYPEPTKRRIAFTAACLHIISPAGLFLSAPYGESAFAMLTFLGVLCYTLATEARFQPKPHKITVCLRTLLAGLAFGLSTAIRSNGVLAGLIFAWDAIEIEGVLQPIKIIQNPHLLTMYLATICAGILVGIGFVAPQAVAYTEYCMGGNTRPWCTRLIPSIYSWVQDHYWEVGFLRYWTLSNLPLFLVAGPMLLMLLYTGWVGLFPPASRTPASIKDFNKATKDRRVYDHVMPRLASQQLILATMAATSFHVQIINRISSGCPLWYILLASTICAGSTMVKRPRVASQIQSIPTLEFLSQRQVLQWIVRAMVMYAIIQGGLYASFLPPA